MASDKAFWAEFFPVNPATGLTVRIRICTSNTPEATGIDLGNGEWMPYMSSFPDTEISVFSGTFDGVSESSISNVEAGDINGFAMLFPSYVWDGAGVRVYKGAEGSTTLGQLTRIFTGVTTETPSNEEGEVKWSIRDKSYLFDVEILKTTYAGTTGYEGTAKMKGVSKPFALGEVLNLEPFLVDPAYLIYQYHGYGRTIGVQGLYENGLGFGAGLTPVAWAGNVAATYAALKAVTLAAGQWVDCPSIGMFRLGGEPLQGGVITCDVKGQERSAGVLCERIDHVLEYLVGLSNVPAAMIDGSSYSNVYANSNSQTIGDYFTSPVNLGEVMAKYLGDAGCYYFVSTGGLLRMGAVRMSTPALEIRSDGTTSPTTETISSLPVSAPYKRIRMGADKVFRVHSLDEISDALYQAVHTLQTQLTDITEDFYLAVDDDNLTIQEKIQTAIPTNTQYGNQYIELRTRALALGLSVTTIDAAYTAYTTDRNAISPAWNDTTQNSTGIPATFRANVAALGSALVALSVDISEEDAKRANWGTVDSRPTELTDGRIAIGIRSTGAIQGTIWGGANTVPIVDLLESGLFGKSLSIDPDFSKGVKPSNFGMYGDGGNGDITSAVINDATAPNGSGKILRVTYDGTGTPGVDPNPGFGGIVQVLSNAGSGMSRPTFYSPNTKVAFIVRAKIPAGRYLEHATNVTGTGGSWTWLTDNAGTGAWQTYIGIRYIGATGTLSTTGHFWISGGANSAFSWDIAVYEQREIASAALPQLNRLIDTVGAMRDDGELITIQGTSASIVGQGYMATQNFADWKTRVSGVGKPSNNAGSSNNLTAIGVGITITGNTVFKNSPGVHGSYDGGAVGVAQKGACFISSGCTYDSDNGGGWRTSLCLDQTNTTSTNGGSTAGNFIAEYTAGNPSSSLNILRHNGSGYVSIGTYTVPGATYSTRRMALATNGLRAFVMIDGVVYGGNTSSFNVAPNTTFWPKVLNYHQDALSIGSTDGIVDVQYGEWTDVRTYLDDGYTILNQAGFKTDEGTASGIIGQGPGATAPSDDVLNYRNVNATTIIQYVGGGQYSYDNVAGGMLRIRLPNGYTNTMVMFTVDIFEYSTGNKQTYIVAGYTSTAGWMNCSAQYIGPEGASKAVRFGDDGARACITIGEHSPASTWNYPKVVIRDVMVGYLNQAASVWKTGWAISIGSPALPAVYQTVTKPRPGDAVFGEGIFESAGGATASLANFKTLLGSAASIVGQGALATKNNVDLSTTQVLPRGSIPSSLANNGFTYTSTVSTITINWPTMTVYRSDGSTISISSGSQDITGLGSGKTYRIYPYVEDNGGSSGTITFVTAVGTAFGSPQILYSNSSPNVAAAASMYFYSRIPMGNFAVATTTSGVIGGGGGGWNCLHESMIVAGKLAHDLEPGDVVLTPEGPTPILQVEHHTCSKWYELYSGEQLVGKFTEKHLLYHAKTGEAVMAANVRLGDILKAIGQHYEITGLRLCNETAIAVGILIEDPHLHFAGESGVLCHNGHSKA